MSILTDVRKKYGIAPSKTAKAAISPFVSNVSLHNKDSEKFLADLAPHDREAGAVLLDIIAMRERGKVPPHYTATTNCRRCGPVPIWQGVPDEVLGCPWCFTGGVPKVRVSGE